MNRLTIVKIGGGIIDDENHLQQFLEDFSNLPEPKLLVHGGGKGASEQLKKLGIEPKMIDGRRITDQATLEVVVSLYAGLLNKNIVAALQSSGTNALGLSGADANTIEGIKRPVKTIDYGFVGDLTSNSINVNFIQNIISQNITPVFCAITHDKQGQLLNTNADTIASTLAAALSAVYEVELHFCFDKIGVLKDINDDNSIISSLDKQLYQQLKDEKVIFEGMIPKLDNAFQVIESGVKSVFLEHPKNIGNEIKTKIH